MRYVTPLVVVLVLCVNVAGQNPEPVAPVSAATVGPVQPETGKPPAAQAAGKVATPQVDETYVLGPEDQITVSVLDLEEFSDASGRDRVYRLDLRGYVNLPLVGRVKAGGLKVEDFEKLLTERLTEYLREPSVTVLIAEYKSQPVSVLGQVTSPGVHQLSGRKTLFEVISMAGGLKPEAGYRLKITRRIEQGRLPLPGVVDDPSGSFSIAELSVQRIMNAESPGENIQIMPHDVITVPKAELVYVVGTVKRPGGFVLGEREKISALQALSLAEGLDREAKVNEAKILRRTTLDAERTEIPVALGQILAGKSPDVAMERDDILFVPHSAARRAVMRTLEAAISMGTGIAIYSSRR